MRLIDADKMIDWINNQREEVTKKQTARACDGIFTRETLVTMQRCIDTFENKIKTEPTAYDPDKVVAELERKKFIEQETILSDIHQGFNAGLSAAIHVVKGGEVE